MALGCILKIFADIAKVICSHRDVFFFHKIFIKFQITGKISVCVSVCVYSNIIVFDETLPVEPLVLKV